MNLLVVYSLVNWVISCSEKGDLKTVAASKVEQITAQLATADGGSKPFDPVDRIKSGFLHFKKEKYEYAAASSSIYSFLFDFFRSHKVIDKAFLF